MPKSPVTISPTDSIVIIGNYDDPIYHWFSKRLQQTEHRIFPWCLDDPALADEDLHAPEGRIILNTTLEKPSYALSSYLGAANMEGHSKPDIILQNVLCETLFQAQNAHLDDFYWVGFSPFSLYGNTQTSTAIELSQLEPIALDSVSEFFSRLHLESILAPNCPSLVLGRIVAMLANEACSALMENVATPEAIDTAMTLGTNYPKGPLAWADVAGLDTILAILNHLYEIYKEPRYRPMRLLQEYVSLGQLGQKTGQGFYSYPQAVSI